jgi:hypothetical protein
VDSPTERLLYKLYDTTQEAGCRWVRRGVKGDQRQQELREDEKSRKQGILAAQEFSRIFEPDTDCETLRFCLSFETVAGRSSWRSGSGCHEKGRADNNTA